MNRKGLAFRTVIVLIILIALVIVVIAFASDITEVGKDAISRFFDQLR